MPTDASHLQVIAYCCEYCAYAAADLAGGLRMQYPPAIKIVQLPCTGKIDILMVLRAFEDVQDLGIPGKFLQQLGLTVTQTLAQGDTAQGDVVAGSPRFGLAHGRFHGVGLLVVGHPGDVGLLGFGHANCELSSDNKGKQAAHESIVANL